LSRESETEGGEQMLLSREIVKINIAMGLKPIAMKKLR